MATPHPALNAAVQQFGHQPGVTPADVAGCKAVVVLKGPEKRSTRLAASKHAREERRLRVQKKR